MRASRQIPEREIALALVLEFAKSRLTSFSLLAFYDNDVEFLAALVERLDVRDDKAFKNKLRRVVRRLVRHGVLFAEMRGTQKDYIGEPAKQMEYGFAKPGKARLLTMGKTEHTHEPEWEASFLLRRAYPATEAEEDAVLLEDANAWYSAGQTDEIAAQSAGC